MRNLIKVCGEPLIVCTQLRVAPKARHEEEKINNIKCYQHNDDRRIIIYIAKMVGNIMEVLTFKITNLRNSIWS
jgi:hypothetical protein